MAIVGIYVRFQGGVIVADTLVFGGIFVDPQKLEPTPNSPDLSK